MISAWKSAATPPTAAPQPGRARPAASPPTHSPAAGFAHHAVYRTPIGWEELRVPLSANQRHLH